VAYGVNVTNKVRATVGDYLGAIERGNYSAAYDLECAAAQRSQSADELAAQFADNKLVSHTLDTPQSVDVGGTSAYAVPADLRFANGQTESERFVVISEGSGLVVCGVAQ